MQKTVRIFASYELIPLFILFQRKLQLSSLMNLHLQRETISINSVCDSINLSAIGQSLLQARKALYLAIQFWWFMLWKYQQRSSLYQILGSLIFNMAQRSKSITCFETDIRITFSDSSRAAKYLG